MSRLRTATSALRHDLHVRASVFQFNGAMRSLQCQFKSDPFAGMLIAALGIPQPLRGSPMLYYALVFLALGLIAGVLGLSGVAAIATQIAWILFVIGIVLLVIHLVTGRTPRTPIT